MHGAIPEECDDVKKVMVEMLPTLKINGLCDLLFELY